MAGDYGNCALCGDPLDFSTATVVVEPGRHSYQPFGEDWRGGRVPMAHPKCFIEREGVDSFLELLGREENRRRSG